MRRLKQRLKQRLEQPVWSFILTRKKQSLAIVFFGLVCQLLTIMIPISVGKYYQLAFGLESRRGHFLDFIPTAWWDNVHEFLILFLGLIVLRYAFFFAYRYTLKMEGERFILDIKNRLFTHQLNIDYGVYQEKGVGKYLLRYSGDLLSLKNLYVKGGLSVLIDVFILIVAFAWFFALSTAGAVIILGGAVLAYWLVLAFNQRLEYFSIAKRDKTAGQLAFVSRTLTAILTVILLNKQKTELKKYRKRSKNILSSAAGYHRWFVVNNGFIAFLQYALLTVVLYWFYYSNNNTISGAELTSFILLYITVLPVIRHLFQLTTVYKLGNISKNKLNNLLDLPAEQSKKGEQVVVPEGDWSLRFEHVDFGSGAIDQQFIGAGVHQLILPPSLSRRAIIYALTGMPQNYQGDIVLNDQNIQHYAPKSLRENISVITPQLPLLGRTVYEAITEKRNAQIKSESGVCLEYVQDALQITPENRLKLIDSIGENGSALTVVQYELLCLVRGLNTDKPLLLVEPLTVLSDNVVRQLLLVHQKMVICLQES